MDYVFDAVNILLVTVIILIMAYPLYFTVIASFSEPYDVVSGKVIFVPSGFTLEAYEYIINDSRIWIGYRNSIIYTVFGTLFNLFLTIPCGYSLSKKENPWKKFLSFYFLFSMYFGGGLIPSYLLMKSLNLLNQPYTLIIVSGLSVYNMIITRVFFQNSIPEEIYESARIDGANDLRCFTAIGLPLSKPIIAVMALYYGVAHWNSFFNALIYVSKTSYQPLQMVLRSILLLNESALATLDMDAADYDMILEMTHRSYVAQAMKYALIIIASAPLLVAYPFVQKYFVKGVMIGSVKG